MGSDLTKQLTRKPRAIMVAAAALFLFGLLPGMPTMTFMVLGAIVGGVGYMTREAAKRQQLLTQKKAQEDKAETLKPQERTEDLLKVDTLGLEIGYGLIPMVDTKQGGDLLARIGTIRKQLAGELGMIVPAIRIRDNIQLGPNSYRVKIKGVQIANFELMTDHLLAINPGYVEEKLDGFETRDPAFGLRAVWIIPNLREIAEAKGYTVVEPSAVVATHLTELIREAADEILTRQDVQHLIDTLKEDYPALVDSIIPEHVSLGMLQKVLSSLLSEKVPIRDLATVLETMSDYVGATKDTDVLTEYVRMALKRQITDLYRDREGKVNVFTVDPAIEQQMGEAVQNTKQGLMLVLDPALTEQLIHAIGKQVELMQAAGYVPACICSPNIRLALRRLVEAVHPQLAVISYNEILPDVELVSTGMVRLNDDN